MEDKIKKNGDDFEKWIDIFKWGATEIGQFENWM